MNKKYSFLRLTSILLILSACFIMISCESDPGGGYYTTEKVTGTWTKPSNGLLESFVFYSNHTGEYYILSSDETYSHFSASFTYTLSSTITGHVIFESVEDGPIENGLYYFKVDGSTMSVDDFGDYTRQTGK